MYQKPAQSSRAVVVPPWPQLADTYCDSSGDINSYSTAAEAVAACGANSDCLYISDGSCDNSGDWETCSNDGASSSSDSCMYLARQEAAGEGVVSVEADAAAPKCGEEMLLAVARDAVVCVHAAGRSRLALHG